MSFTYLGMSLTDLPNWGSEAVAWLPSLSWWASDTLMAANSWEPAGKGRGRPFFHYYNDCDQNKGEWKLHSFFWKGQCSYPVVVVGSPGWEMQSVKLLLLLPGSRSTMLLPRRGSRWSSLYCDPSPQTHSDLNCRCVKSATFYIFFC